MVLFNSIFKRAFTINCKYYELLYMYYVRTLQAVIKYDFHLVGFEEVVLFAENRDTETRIPALRNIMLI